MIWLPLAIPMPDRFREETVFLNFLLFYPQFEWETTIDVIKLKMVVSDEPDA